MHIVSPTIEHHHIEWNGGNTFQVVNELTGEAVYAFTSYRKGKVNNWSLKSAIKYACQYVDEMKMKDFYDQR